MSPIPQSSSVQPPVVSSVAAAVAARSSHRRWAMPSQSSSIVSTPSTPPSSSMIGPMTPTSNAGCSISSSNANCVTPDDDERRTGGGGPINSASGSSSTAVVISPYSSLASQCIQREEFDKAIQWYQMALKEYCHHSDVGRRRREKQSATPTYGIVELCNAAATCFNLGAVSKKIHKYERAVLYYQQSEKLYRQCVEMVKSEIHRSQQQQRDLSPRKASRRRNRISILSGSSSASASSSSSPTSSGNKSSKGSNNHQSAIATTATEVTTATTSSSSVNENQGNAMKVCLMQLIVETLQTRGHVHYKYQNSIEEAIDCHEEVITLLDIDEDDENDSNNNEEGLIDSPEDKHINESNSLPLLEGDESDMLVERDDTEEDRDRRMTGSLSRRFRRSPPPSLAINGDGDAELNDSAGSTSKILISNIWFMVTSDAIDPEEKRYELLSMSYQQLGMLYIHHGDVEDGFRAYQEALYILRNRLVHSTRSSSSTSSSSPQQKKRDHQQTMAKILCKLSDLYLQRQDTDHAMDSIQDYLEIRRVQHEQEQEQEDSSVSDIDQNDGTTKNSTENTSLALAGTRRGRSGASSVSSGSSSSISSASYSALDIEALAIVEKIALANEQVGYWDKALNCYERVLLMQSQHFGPYSERVAETLVRLGRVMTFQGNPEGGLDLYLAAYDIYAKNRLLMPVAPEDEHHVVLDINNQTLAVVPEDATIDEEALKLAVVSSPSRRRRRGIGSGRQGGERSLSGAGKKVMPLELIQMVSRGLVQLGREVEAVEFLSSCIERQRQYRNLAADEDEDEIEMEERDCHEADIFRELGLTYMELNLYGKASECLVESVRLLEGTSNEEQVFGLLQRVEFLQRMDSVDKEEKEDDNWSDGFRNLSIAASFEETDSKDEVTQTSEDDDDNVGNDMEDRSPGEVINGDNQAPYSSHMFVAEESTLPLESSPIAISGLANLATSSAKTEHVVSTALEQAGIGMSISGENASYRDEPNEPIVEDDNDKLRAMKASSPDQDAEESDELGQPTSQLEDDEIQDEQTHAADDCGSTASGDADVVRLEHSPGLEVIAPDLNDIQHHMPNDNGSKGTQSTEASFESFSRGSAHTSNVPSSPNDDADDSTPGFKPIHIVQSLVASGSLGYSASIDGSALSALDDILGDGDKSMASVSTASNKSDADSRPSRILSKISSDADSLPSHYFNLPEPEIQTSQQVVAPDVDKDPTEQQTSQTKEASSILQGLSAEELELIERRRICIPKLRLPDDSLPDRSISPAESATSRTGLLNAQAKDIAFQPTSGSKSSIRIPTLAQKYQKKDKKEYAEMQAPKGSSRNQFLKALSSPFRRATSFSRKRSGSALGSLDEEREATAPSTPLSPRSMTDPHPKQQAMLPLPDDYNPSGAPVPYISASLIDDDNASQVSQLTFQFEETVSKQRSNDSGWWWGVSAEGLEGWFPSTYVSQAVEAAEGFLSAKSIHDRVKSRPLDFDSDEESEVDAAAEARVSNPVDLDDLDDQSLGSASTSSSQKNRKKESSAMDSKPVQSTGESKVLPVDMSKRKVSNASSTKVAAGSSAGGANRNQSLAAEILEHEEILKKQKRDCGPEHITVAATLFTLSVLHMKNRDLNSAVVSVMAALEIQKSLGNFPDAARCLHFLADLHSSQKQYSAALSCYEEARKLQEATFGMFHEEVANTLNRIGNVLARQGEFALAMEQHQGAMLILKECFGEDVKHPLVSHTLIQIGAVYYKERNSLSTIQANVDNDGAYSTFIEGGMLEVIGRAHDDRGSYRMAIAFFEEKLQFLDDKEDSPDLDQVAETLNSLGMLSTRAGLYMEAIDYYDRALSIQMKLGCDDVQLGMARVLTGSVQYYLGHYRKALKLFQEGLKILNKNVGKSHETVAATLYQKSLVHAALCEYDSAMSSLMEAFEIQIRILGPDHPATLRTRREIGNNYAIYKAELPTAFELFKDVIDRQKRIHGEKHPNIADTLHSIGCAQARGGEYQKALKTLEDCYNMRLEFLGMDHPSQATTLHEIAKIQQDRGRLKKAIHICDAALQIRLECLSENHIDVASVMSTKASCLVAKGSFAEANKLFLQALPIAEASVGPNHPNLAIIHVQIGSMHLRKCHFDEATESIQKALDMYRKSNLDEDHPGIKQALVDLEQVERSEMLCV